MTRTTSAALIIYAILCTAAGATQPLLDTPYPWAPVLTAWTNAVSSYRGRGEVKLYGEAEGDFGIAFACAPPAAARLEISAPLAGTVFYVVASGGSILACDPINKEALTGPDDETSTDAVLGFGLGRLADTVGALAGLPPSPDWGTARGATPYPVVEGDAVTVTWRASDETPLRAFSWRETTPPVPLAARYYDHGVVAAQAQYRDIRRTGDWNVPFAVTITTADLTAEIALTSFEINVPLPPTAFDLTPPPAFAVTPLPATGP